ncbi:MAG: AMP-binding protein [Brevundimonas sp.]|jgi:bile acid-coenzyme A ligase|uniref:AMP-binding protein n=1 Tax=Brevundimonas sp. TaxID=1871086 RepID=UPI0025BB3BE2|nr:AMP-binding protein [Brevundimonas sp.]MCH4269687.1 AMP-binding protein [Brevundimonas sp.]
MMIPFADVPAWYAAHRQADAVAVRQGDNLLSWAELDRRSSQRAHAFAARGVKAGDFVAIGLLNSVTYFEVTFAVWKLGATIAPISSRLPPGEARRLLALLEPALLVGGDLDWGDWPRISVEADLEDWPTTGFAAPISRHWAVLSSGGSTGCPKLIVQHMMAVTGNTYRVLAGLAPGQRILNPGAPMHHTAPLLSTHWALFLGAEVVSMPAFDAEAVLQHIQAHRITWLYMVPTMMHRIWALPPEVRGAYDLSSLQFVIHTAAPIPAWLKTAWIEWIGPEKIFEFYGGTENSGAVVIRGDEWLSHPGSVGYADPERVRILDDRGREVPPGTVGEIYFMPPNGPGSTFHYIGSAPRRGPDGWETFGDFGHVGADGYLYIADRREDMIIRGGVNVFPAEIESALLAHADVVSCTVIGLPDEDLGQRLHAIVQLRPGVEPAAFADGAEVFLTGRLSAHKHPGSYEAVTDPVRDDAGKVRRMALRAERVAWLRAGHAFEIIPRPFATA